MPRLASAAIALPLLFAATPALAHGIEGFMQALAIVGTTVGVIGGALTAAFRFKAIVGLACSLALLFAGGIAVVLSDAGSYGWNDIGAVALWLVLFAALPLVVIFVVTFAGLSVVRNRIWPTRTKSDPAP